MQLNLLPFLEQLNFFRQKIKHKKSNRLFKKENPSIKLPPDFYLYETFNLDYKKFYTEGIPTAKWLLSYIEEFLPVKNISILDWGCGTGRVIRHLPTVAGNSNVYYACDYNEKYIKWCSENLVNIDFKLNNLSPPLDYKSNFFNVIYGISIFTHLSERMHYDWMKELTRVLKKNGILLLTTHGVVHSNKLLKKEKILFDAGNLIVHNYKKEGNRLFASYQSPSFFKNLCKMNNLEILKHISREIKNERPQQDIWILKKV